MEKLLLVDGSNLLFQMFYGMPARIVNGKGRAIQGTLGFVGALLKILRMTRPTHAAVLFDGEYTSERTALDGDYKGNRPDYSQLPEEDTPFSQLPDICRALEHLNIFHQETTDCEADDWISGFAKEYGDRMEIVIASQDSDFFQLISDNVKILRYRGKNTLIWDRAYLRERLGVAPEQYAAFKALTGDTADNIRGADKIGPKTAAALMDQFENLEELLAHPERIGKPSIRESVTRNAERIRLNHALIRLDGAKELPCALEALVWQDTVETTTEVLKSLEILP